MCRHVVLVCIRMIPLISVRVVMVYVGNVKVFQATAQIVIVIHHIVISIRQVVLAHA